VQAALAATLKGFQELANPANTSISSSPASGNAHSPSRSTAVSMAKKHHAVQPASPRSPNSPNSPRTYKSYSNSLFVAISTTSSETPTVGTAPRSSIPQSVVASEGDKVELTGSRLRSVLSVWGGQLLAAAQQHTADRAALAGVRTQLAQSEQAADECQAAAAAASQVRLQQQAAAAAVAAGAQVQPAAGQTRGALLAQMERLLQGRAQQEVLTAAQKRQEGGKSDR
jgi:hypothetical protein